MKSVFPVFLLFLACVAEEKKDQQYFPVIEITDNEWATYEGRWLTDGGIVDIELSLKSGAFGIDSYFELNQRFLSNTTANGIRTNGLYSTNSNLPGKELGICLHDLGLWKRGYLRYRKSNGAREVDEMFFVTRGNQELLPCDDKYTPLTTDWRYTLHKRSKLFTVEGYFTFDQDSAEFYERNTMERWKLAQLAEFENLKMKYKQLAKEKYEGIYLKALAYSVADMTSQDKELLVIREIKDIANDPD
jgi:hypothetical protein